MLEYSNNKAEHSCRSHPKVKSKGVNKFKQWDIVSFVCYAYYARMTVCFPCFFDLFYLEVLTISSKEILINEDIRAKEVRVIDTDGSQLGILPIRDALAAAAAKNLDLVDISPNAVPPVCKIMDFGKYRYEQSKREKEARKNQKVVDVKEIRLGLSIDTHDFETKGNQAIRFIKGGDKVKVSIRFRGREFGHPEIGIEIMERFAKYCEEAAVVEKPAKMEGRNMLMFLAPRPTK